MFGCWDLLNTGKCMSMWSVCVCVCSVHWPPPTTNPNCCPFGSDIPSLTYMHWIALHCIASCFAKQTSLQCITVHHIYYRRHITKHDMTWRDIASRYTAHLTCLAHLHYHVTLHLMMSHPITSRHVTSHNVTMHWHIAYTCRICLYGGKVGRRQQQRMSQKRHLWSVLNPMDIARIKNTNTWQRNMLHFLSVQVVVFQNYWHIVYCEATKFGQSPPLKGECFSGLCIQVPSSKLRLCSPTWLVNSLLIIRLSHHSSPFGTTCGSTRHTEPSSEFFEY